jgi:hypothetical protein
MMPREHDAWQKTFYHRAIQTSLGSALRAQYDLTEPLPDRLTQLLRELDDLEQPDGGDASGGSGPALDRRQTGQP